MNIERRNQTEQRWVIKKEFSVGDGIAILFAFLTIVSVYYKVDTRLIVLENADQARRVHIDRFESKADRKFDQIDSKLDQLLIAVSANEGFANRSGPMKGMSGMNGNGRGAER